MICKNKHNTYKKLTSIEIPLHCPVCHRKWVVLIATVYRETSAKLADWRSLMPPVFRLLLQPFHKTHQVSIAPCEGSREDMCFPFNIADEVVAVVVVVVWTHFFSCHECCREEKSIRSDQRRLKVSRVFILKLSLPLKTSLKNYPSKK